MKSLCEMLTHNSALTELDLGCTPSFIINIEAERDMYVTESLIV